MAIKKNDDKEDTIKEHDNKKVDDKQDGNKEDENREDDDVHQIITEQKMKNDMLVHVTVFKVQRSRNRLKPTSCGHEFQLFFQCFGFRSIEILRNVSTWHNIFCDVLGLLRSSIGTVREHLRAI